MLSMKMYFLRKYQVWTVMTKSGQRGMVVDRGDVCWRHHRLCQTTSTQPHPDGCEPHELGTDVRAMHRFHGAHWLVQLGSSSWSNHHPFAGWIRLIDRIKTMAVKKINDDLESPILSSIGRTMQRKISFEVVWCRIMDTEYRQLSNTRAIWNPRTTRTILRHLLPMFFILFLCIYIFEICLRIAFSLLATRCSLEWDCVALMHAHSVSSPANYIISSWYLFIDRCFQLAKTNTGVCQTFFNGFRYR